jgi:7-cyano-7-deazaguanine synthase
MKTSKPKGVVLVSGGMDSCVTAAIAAQAHRLALAHVSYGQRTEARERRAFGEIADFYGVEDRLAVRMDYFREIGGSALTDPRIAVPEVEEPHGPTPGPALGREVPPTYVPFRNAHLLALGVSWAEAIGADAVYIGAVWADSSGYPDCRQEFYHLFNELVRTGTKPETRLRILTPVIGLRKSEIVRRGIELGAPLHLTWSCYQFDDEACGGCESCVLRLQAFAGAGVRDPIAYRARVGR